MQQDETFLYRFFDADDELLYVGISTSALRRFEEHQRDKPWSSQIRRSTITPFVTREAALEAERAAIQTEHPRFNIVHNKVKTLRTNRITALVPVRALAAIGLADNRCPLGVVTAADDKGLVLAQLGGLSHGYDHALRGSALVVRWSDVLDLAWTLPKPGHRYPLCGSYEWYEGDRYCGRGVGQFQGDWMRPGRTMAALPRAHGTCDEVQNLLRPEVLFLA